ncbi:MAG TPA: aminodeoxychorismate/anthranilate synthase component II [Sphingomicrobium sp.]
MAAVRILVVDNFDSFTFTLVDYLRTLEAVVDVVRNDEVRVDQALDGGFDAFLISPGPGRPEEAGISIDLSRACMQQQRPLLGVCLGHQAIAVACGQTVSKVPPMHGKIARLSHDGSGIFAGLGGPFNVTRYHSLAAADVGPPLVANAWSEDGLIMGLRHESAPVHGVQFHPESIATDHGHALLGNFLALASNQTGLD